MAMRPSGADTARWRELDARHHLPIHRSGGARRQGRAGHHARRGLLAVGQRGQPHPGWHGGPVVRERRLWPGRAGRGGAAPDGDPAVLQHLLPVHDGASHRAGGAAGGDRAGFDRVFFTNSGSEANDTVVKLVRYFWKLHGKPQKQTMIGHLRLPRRDARRGEPVRPAQHAPAVRPAAAGLRARACPLLVRRGRRLDPGGIRATGGAGARAEDPGAGTRDGRRVHRRAGPGRRRRDHSAGWATGPRSSGSAGDTTCF